MPRQLDGGPDRAPCAFAELPADALATAAGLAAGSPIYTCDGVLPVEFLSPGDRIIARDAGAVTLRAISHRRIMARAVMVSAGALGATRPETPLVLLPDQQVFLRNWLARALRGADHALVEASCLVDNRYIRLAPQPLAFDVFDLDLGGRHIIYADGVELLCPAAQDAGTRLAQPA